MEGVDAVESASVDETHKQITDISPVFSPIKETVLPMKDGPLENLFTDIIVQGYSGNA